MTVISNMHVNIPTDNLTLDTLTHTLHINIGLYVSHTTHIDGYIRYIESVLITPLDMTDPVWMRVKGVDQDPSYDPLTLTLTHLGLLLNLLTRSIHMYISAVISS